MMANAMVNALVNSAGQQDKIGQAPTLIADARNEYQLYLDLLIFC